jgi:hypothetical protein
LHGATAVVGLGTVVGVDVVDVVEVAGTGVVLVAVIVVVVQGFYIYVPRGLHERLNLCSCVAAAGTH